MGIFGGKDDKKEVEKADFGNVKSGGSPDFSNVVSGSSSTAPEADAPTTERSYVVVKGDTLSRIAKHEYGDAAKWRQIYEANTDIIKNPDLIYPGQKLRLP